MEAPWSSRTPPIATYTSMLTSRRSTSKTTPSPISNTLAQKKVVPSRPQPAQGHRQDNYRRRPRARLLLPINPRRAHPRRAQETPSDSRRAAAHRSPATTYEERAICRRVSCFAASSGLRREGHEPMYEPLSVTTASKSVYSRERPQPLPASRSSANLVPQIAIRRRHLHAT